MNQQKTFDWIDVCDTRDLVPDAGVAAWTPAGAIAIFHLPDTAPGIFAISHYCPLGGAHVLARGIVGDIQGEPVVASPLYKQHYSLRSGQCLEEPDVRVPTFEARIDSERVQIRATREAKASRAA